MQINVFIDSNILFEDYFFYNKSNKNILEYANQGLITIFMSNVVKMELRQQFKKEIEGANKEINKLASNAVRLKDRNTYNLIDLDKRLLDFDAFYDNLQDSSNFNILKYNNEFLDDLVNRAVSRRKPFSETKTELKDAIIWKTYYEYVESLKVERCIFLTNNTSDFCSKNDKSKVHNELLSDTERFEVVNSSYAFIRSYGNEIESPENKFIAYVTLLEIDESFVFGKIKNNFLKNIDTYVHTKIDSMHPSQILKNEDYIMDGQINGYGIELLECDEINVDLLSTKALISGVLFLTCETEIFAYNPFKEYGEDSFNSVSENYVTFALYFNFDLEQGEVCKEFEITDMEISHVE